MVEVSTGDRILGVHTVPRSGSQSRRPRAKRGRQSHVLRACRSAATLGLVAFATNLLALVPGCPGVPLTGEGNDQGPGQEIPDAADRSVDVTLGGNTVGTAQFTEAFRDLSGRVRVLQVIEMNGFIDLENEPEPPFDPGDVVFAEGPEGPIVGRVVEIQSTDRIFAGATGRVVAVDIMPVGLADVFVSLELEVRDHPLTPAEELPAAGGCRRIVDNAQLSATGCYDVGFNPDPHIDFKLRFKESCIDLLVGEVCGQNPFKGIEEAKLVLTAGVEGELEVAADIKRAFVDQRFEELLRERSFDPLCFGVGPLSLCINTKLAVGAGIEGRSDGSGDVTWTGSAGVGWIAGIDCPRGEGCSLINMSLPGADATLDYELEGAAQLRAFGNVTFSANLEVISLVELGSLDLGLETYLAVRSERDTEFVPPLRPGDPCSGVLQVGFERVRYELAAGGEGTAEGEILLGLFEGRASFGLFEFDLLESCHTFGGPVIGDISP